VLELHPDKRAPLSVMGHNHGAIAAFQQVSEAYEVLGDDFRRMMYDAQRNAAAQNSQLERSSLLAPKHARGNSASMLSPDFYERSNALWSEQFRERNGRLERRPASRQGGGTASRPPTGGRDGICLPQMTSLPAVGIAESGDRPPSRQIGSSIGVRQLFLRRTRTPSNPEGLEFPPRPASLPTQSSQLDPAVENDLPSFRPIRGVARHPASSPLQHAKTSADFAATSFLSSERRKKLSKQERSQLAASVKTLRTFFS
jgi:curved DNA-binding protein CbpA